MCSMLQHKATAWPPLSRTTPFGLAVVPEVYRMYSGSEAATGTQPTGLATEIAWSQSRSRPAVRVAGACGRWTITQWAGLRADSPMARSRIGLYSTIRLASRPHEAGAMTLG